MLFCIKNNKETKQHKSNQQHKVKCIGSEIHLKYDVIVADNYLLRIFL
jgi:hypothetical protein